VALNTSKPARVESNLNLVNAVLPAAFWDKLKAEGLIKI
jgi:D-threo-aldose 1-dehydrogenase